MRKNCVYSKFNFLFLIVFVLASCSQVHFDTDLPKNDISTKTFDSDIRGQYNLIDSVVNLKNEKYYNSNYFSNLFKTKDSCVLILSSMTITEKKLFYSIIIKSYYNRNKVDTVSVINRHKKEKINYEDGYLSFEGFSSDTLLNMNKKDKIRSNKRNLYLNHFIEEHDWEIYQLEIIMDHQLSINLMNSDDEAILKEYFIKKHQILGNIVHLSDNQFNNFVEKGGFRTRFRFKRND